MWATMPRSSIYPALSHVQNNHTVLLLVKASEFIIDRSTIVTTKLMLLIPLRSVFLLGDIKTHRRPSFGDEVSRLDNCCDHSFNYLLQVCNKTSNDDFRILKELITFISGRDIDQTKKRKV
jgi:hypothetical protein